MKKFVTALLAGGLVLSMLTGCGDKGADGGKAAENTETYNDRQDIKQAGLGGLALLYDDSVWTRQEEQETDTSLAFEDQNGSVLGISCSKETTYQHPLDMISMSRQIYSTYEGYEEIEAPSEVEAQDSVWYEWVYKYVENGVPTVVAQRFYAKNYYAYTMTYVAEEKAYDAGRSEAMKVMNSAVMDVPGNEEAEKKAKEFLVGEWDLGDSGYLVMEQDGTYTWYMTSDKNEDNMHKGTYGCDVENSSLGFGEGEGIYFVLFPEVLYVEGEETTTASAKYDYGVSLEQQADGSYQMINVATFAMYTMEKQ